MCYLTARVWHEPISRYGVNALLPGRAGCTTSHGIVLISNVHEMVGVHRYKLVLLMLFPASHPIVV